MPAITCHQAERRRLFGNGRDGLPATEGDASDEAADTGDVRRKRIGRSANSNPSASPTGRRGGDRGRRVCRGRAGRRWRRHRVRNAEGPSASAKRSPSASGRLGNVTRTMCQTVPLCQPHGGGREQNQHQRPQQNAVPQGRRAAPAYTDRQKAHAAHQAHGHGQVDQVGNRLGRRHDRSESGHGYFPFFSRDGFDPASSSRRRSLDLLRFQPLGAQQAHHEVAGRAARRSRPRSRRPGRPAVSSRPSAAR